MNILVLGRTGQLARALTRRAAQRGLVVTALGRPELDLGNSASLDRAVRKRAPSVIINAAAYTAVDNAEADAERAFAINAVGAEVSAKAAREVGASFIQVSTDYVFSGDKPAPYGEEDPAAPTGVYGASKLAGERAVLAAHPDAVVVRTAWVYDSGGVNFVRTMLRLATTRDEVPVVADQVGCPTYAGDLADVLLAIAQAPTPGVYHCAGAGETSWAGFAQAIFEEAGARAGPIAAVKAISTAEYPTRAKRPANSRLDCAKLERVYGVRMRPWREALAACMDEIAGTGWDLQ